MDLRVFPRPRIINDWLLMEIIFLHTIKNLLIIYWLIIKNRDLFQCVILFHLINDLAESRFCKLVLS